MIDLLVISTPTSVSSTTSLSSSLRDSETRLLVSIRGSCYPASPSLTIILLTLSVYRVHNSHDEENPKGTSQGNFAEVARGGTQSFFYLIYYIRKERERWTLFPRSPNSKSTTSTSRTRSSARCSRKSVSRSSSPARRENDQPPITRSYDQTAFFYCFDSCWRKFREPLRGPYFLCFHKRFFRFINEATLLL